MIEVAVFDTKSYDRDLSNAVGAERVAWKFHEFRLSAETASAARGAQAVCLFVNDQADRECLQILGSLGIKLIALRCSGYNNIDPAVARELGLAVVRVPAYSPHAVAEYAVALLLTLNRKIHRAFNRVRELNFSLGGLVGFDLHGRTVGIIGTGKIGRIVAQIFRGFEMDVLALDACPALEWAAKHGIRYVGSPADASASTEFLDETLAIARDPAAWPILVHCHGCMDRTPAWVGIYEFVVEGKPLDGVMKFIERHRGYRPKASVTLLYNRELTRLAPERAAADPVARLLKLCAGGTRVPFIAPARTRATASVSRGAGGDAGVLPSLTPRR